MERSAESNSILLFETLDKIGVSERQRRLVQKASLYGEILLNISRQEDWDHYSIGSTVEGSVKLGSKVGVNSLECTNGFNIIDSLYDARNVEKAFLVVRDTSTPVGYVKLQAVVDGETLTSSNMDQALSIDNVQLRLDGRGRNVAFNCGLKLPKRLQDIKEKMFAKRFSAFMAGSVKEQGDITYGLRLQKWPECASEWIFRRRDYKWPTKNCIQDFTALGCFLVGVGHPDSKEQHLEWRISFPLQERKLMFGLNDVQYKCYVALKFVKDDLLRKDIVNLGCMTSYHCKTCVFYMIEQTPKAFWKRNNLCNCIIECLQLFLIWAKNGHCPNYFIPDENMFDKWEVKPMLPVLRNNLRVIIGSGPEFLREDILKVIKGYLEGQEQPETIDEFSNRLFSQTIKQSMNCPVTLVACCLKERLALGLGLFEGSQDSSRYSVEGSKNTMNALDQFIIRLRHTDTVLEHTAKDTINVINILLPFLQTMLASHRIVCARQSGNDIDAAQLHNFAMDDFSNGISSDLTSGRLKYLLCLYLTGEHNRCREQLLSMGTKCREHYVYISPFSCKPINISNNTSFPEFAKDAFYAYEFFKHYVNVCVFFLPTELPIIPTALQYEVFRTVGLDSKSKSDPMHDWVFVDVSIFYYFLLYLNDKKLNKTLTECFSRILNMLASFANDKIVFHPRTAFNLIAWAFAEEGYIAYALYYFIMSWIKPYSHFISDSPDDIDIGQHRHRNAASWHILLLIWRIWSKKSALVYKHHISFCFRCFRQDVSVLKMCSECKIARYCCIVCQEKDWKTHQKICEKFR